MSVRCRIVFLYEMMSNSRAFHTGWPSRSPTFFFFVMTTRYIPNTNKYMVGNHAFQQTSGILYVTNILWLLWFLSYIPATKRIVPMSPHIGLASADAGTSLLTKAQNRKTTMVRKCSQKRCLASLSSEPALHLMMISTLWTVSLLAICSVYKN